MHERCLPEGQVSFIQCVAFCEEQNATLHLRLTLGRRLERISKLNSLILGLHLLIDLHDELVPGAKCPLSRLACSL